jgi:hypothetical protein
MILELTHDMKLIKDIMTDDDIWSKIRSDICTKEEFDPIFPANAIIVAAIVDSVIGLHIFSWHEKKVLYHPMLLKPYRKSHGRLFFEKGLKWFFDNTSSTTLEAEIPVNHTSTINLAKKLNFKKIDKRKGAVKQDGKLIDIQVLRLEK